MHSAYISDQKTKSVYFKLRPFIVKPLPNTIYTLLFWESEEGHGTVAPLRTLVPAYTGWQTKNLRMDPYLRVYKRVKNNSYMNWELRTCGKFTENTKQMPWLRISKTNIQWCAQFIFLESESQALRFRVESESSKTFSSRVMTWSSEWPWNHMERKDLKNNKAQRIDPKLTTIISEVYGGTNIQSDQACILQYYKS